jgi:hypothetical protein
MMDFAAFLAIDPQSGVANPASDHAVHQQYQQ